MFETSEAVYPHLTMNATYSPEDNKLRLYASARLPSELYQRVRAAGFILAPKQGLFVAPKWTPEREDLLVELCGEVGDEDTSLVDRAEERADRFDTYAGKREADALNAKAGVDAIAKHIPMGQPILVGHHSERRARKDAERIENGMRKTIKMWETAKYWERRAEGALRNAAYKERDDVRERRIKGLEADLRKRLREVEAAEKGINTWTRIGAMEDSELQLKNAIHLANYQLGCPSGTWSALRDGKSTVAEVVEASLAMNRASIALDQRWVEHLNHRLAYERVLLGRKPDEVTPKAKPVKSAKASAPLLNYRAEVVVTLNQYHGTEYPLTMIEMTAAEYKRKPADFKGTALSFDRTHRVRTVCRNSAGGMGRYFVFLTDSKEHPAPEKAQTAEAAQ